MTRPWDPFSPPAPTVPDGDGSEGVATPQPADPTGAPLPEDLAELDKDDLIALAKQRDVPHWGTKAQIAARLRADED